MGEYWVNCNLGVLGYLSGTLDDNSGSGGSDEDRTRDLCRDRAAL